MLILGPNLILGLVGIAHTGEVWIRVVGMLVLFLGVYYVGSAKTEFLLLFRLSVPVRASVLGFFLAFVGFGLVEPELLLFGVVDLMAAAWTWVCLRVDGGATLQA